MPTTEAIVENSVGTEIMEFTCTDNRSHHRETVGTAPRFLVCTYWCGQNIFKSEINLVNKKSIERLPKVWDGNELKSGK